MLYRMIENPYRPDLSSPKPRFTCPDCGFAGMIDPPKDYNICPECMVEFGLDDANTLTADKLAEETATRMTQLIAETPEDGITPSQKEFDRAVIWALENMV